MSSHLSLCLPLGLFPIVYIFITTLRVDSSSLLVTWPNHRSLFLSLTWTMGSILLCWYRSSFLLLSHLVTPFTILITFMYAVIICYSSLLVKVQHSLPKIRIGLKMGWCMICFGMNLAFTPAANFIGISPVRPLFESDYNMIKIYFSR